MYFRSLFISRVSFRFPTTMMDESSSIRCVLVTFVVFAVLQNILIAGTYGSKSQGEGF